jgi:UDP-2,3-diacylglucosamine pyrophosphatase LpxH
LSCRFWSSQSLHIRWGLTLALMQIRSLFISDVHLGNPNCQADKLLDVFREYEFENLFIVGDFIDMTLLKRKFYWKQDHSTVIQKVLRFSRKEVKVTYIVGNHDYYVRSLIEEGNIHVGDILLCDEFIHTTASGERIYITHGDNFDGFIRMHPFLYWLGDQAYEFSITINNIYNAIRKLFGSDYWSLSAYLKTKVKNVIKFINEYKKMADEKLKEVQCDAMLMGHTHTPEIELGKYYNTGDFCESCSYIIENLDGRMELKFCV